MVNKGNHTTEHTEGMRSRKTKGMKNIRNGSWNAEWSDLPVSNNIQTTKKHINISWCTKANIFEMSCVCVFHLCVWYVMIQNQKRKKTHKQSKRQRINVMRTGEGERNHQFWQHLWFCCLTLVSRLYGPPIKSLWMCHIYALWLAPLQSSISSSSSIR